MVWPVSTNHGVCLRVGYQGEDRKLAAIKTVGFDPKPSFARVRRSYRRGENYIVQSSLKNAAIVTGTKRPFRFERIAQAAVQAGVNSAACSLTKSYMLVGFWPVSLNKSSVIRS